MTRRLMLGLLAGTPLSALVPKCLPRPKPLAPRWRQWYTLTITERERLEIVGIREYVLDRVRERIDHFFGEWGWAGIRTFTVAVDKPTGAWIYRFEQAFEDDLTPGVLMPETLFLAYAEACVGREIREGYAAPDNTSDS